jgi:hypothetical protein
MRQRNARGDSDISMTNVPTLFAIWSDIKNWCSGGDAEAGLARIRATAKTIRNRRIRHSEEG